MSVRRRTLLRTIPFLAVGLLIFLLYLVLFPPVDISQMVEIIAGVNLPVYLLAASAVIVETLLFTLTWQYLLLPLSVNIPLRRIFAYVWIGIFADLLIPAESISGEIVKTYLVSKESNNNPGKVVASLVSQRMLGTIATTVTLLIGFMGLLAFNYSMPSLVFEILLAISILSAAGIAFMVMVCIREDWTERLVRGAIGFAERVSKGRFKLQRFQTKVIGALESFYESLSTFSSNPAKLIPSVLFFSLTWLSSIAVVFLVFASIGYFEPDVPTLLLKIAIVNTLLVAVKSIPLGIPAEVGLPDIIMATLFILFGISPDVSAAATVLSRILTVWFRFVIGLFVVQWLGIKRLMESGVFGKAPDKI